MLASKEVSQPDDVARQTGDEVGETNESSHADGDVVAVHLSIQSMM